MNLEQRKDYTATVAAMFLTCGILFGLIAAVSGELLFFGHRFVDATLVFLFAGWGFASMFSGFYLTVGFIGRKNRRFKVLCSVLFLLVADIALIVGVFATVPYWIYSILQIRKEKADQAEL